MSRRHILVLGLGLSGISAARLLLSEGCAVTVLDAKSNDELTKKADALTKAGATVSTDAKEVPAGKFDFCVASPGFRLDSPWVKEIQRRGIPVESEIETAFARCSCPVLAVTGSNGKSTFAKLVSEMLQAGGLESAVAGNYGIAFSDVVGSGMHYDWIVVEISSFQLETIRSFRPGIAVLLNIQANHLDRHADMDEYSNAKCRIFENMKRDDVAIVGDDIMKIAAAMTKGSPSWFTFGSRDGLDCMYKPGAVSAFGSGDVNITGTLFDNRILGPSAAAALGSAFRAGVKPAEAARAIKSFKPLAHRMEPAGCRNGVTFINNSKATTLSSLSASLEMCGGKVRLIAGGLLKEKNLDCIKIILEKYVKGAYLIGSCAEGMKEAWGGSIPCRLCGDLENAVKAAWGDAREGECILLAPGCASFDQFRNFEERGEIFKKIVSKL
jgi:UDP-N-acetylmuramoylalanine--D-glutamate ligase